ncbi:thioredoxin-like protein [Halteromyces radiatus]|uniref:thioredoxin-like protein n=1 Tax=Halteromyces radiatus TaxID=101107 RepID=UPI0022200131|nr:thioredoxin-like protein [Halteromyces radiatus]KAI8076368.1 thioredoxin-like protein [Halteromyces radiatus]
MTKYKKKKWIPCCLSLSRLVCTHFYFYVINRSHELEDLSDDEALFEELERDDDDAMAKIREQRIREIQQELERRQVLQDNQHGIYTEIEKEKEFMDTTVKEKYMVGHFYHKDFRRCKIMDSHLEQLAEKFPDTRFVKISVENAPFLVEKLQVRVLPCVMGWVDGFIKTKLVGFDELGNTDDFSTNMLQVQLVNAGVIRKKEQTTIQQKKSIFQKVDSDDEDYDD